jgi:GNAT superfamily N-acetyltransferase
MDWTRDGFTISDDPDRLDLDYIICSLHTTYWAGTRPEAKIRQSYQNSLCFGLYEGDRQVGFARVVTDGCTFSWICDVFIAPDYRGRGLGTWLMECAIGHPRVAPTVQYLATRDAHGLYEKLGFERRELMFRRPTSS